MGLSVLPGASFIRFTIEKLGHEERQTTPYSGGLSDNTTK